MKYTLFKPTPKNTGALVDFTAGADKDNKSCVYINAVKQKSWDDSKKVGSFSWGDDREGNTAGVKLDITELGSIVCGFRTNFERQQVKPKDGEPFNGVLLYHKSKDYNTIVTLKAGDGRGFLLSILRGDFKTGVGITYGEAEVLRNLFEAVIKERMNEDHAEEQERMKAFQGKSAKKKTAKKEDVESDGSDGSDEEDQDVPF